VGAIAGAGGAATSTNSCHTALMRVMTALKKSWRLNEYSLHVLQILVYQHILLANEVL
jgi:hypothetical protein